MDKTPWPKNEWEEFQLNWAVLVGFSGGGGQFLLKACIDNLLYLRSSVKILPFREDMK